MTPDKGYYLPGCVVLAATVLGTRRAYQEAMHILPAARRLDAERFPACVNRAEPIEDEESSED
jgi:hypothetical protein